MELRCVIALFVRKFVFRAAEGFDPTQGMGNKIEDYFLTSFAELSVVIDKR